MLKKTLKYIDFNGVEREEDHYFNLSKAELLEMEMSHNGGLTVYIERIAKTNDSKELIAMFKSLILKSYGIKSDDGKRFIKSEEATKAFTETTGYSDLFIELATNTDAATHFINNIVPIDVKKELEKQPIAAANIGSV